MQTIRSFTGEHRFLSNFYIEGDGSNVEREYQAAKFHCLRHKFAILTAKTPGEAKRLGRSRAVPIRSDWEQIKYHVMQELVLRKFIDDRGLVLRLLATDGFALVEGNTWHDNIWGNCFCRNCTHITGTNFLGQILVEVRHVLSKEL